MQQEGKTGDDDDDDEQGSNSNEHEGAQAWKCKLQQLDERVGAATRWAERHFCTSESRKTGNNLQAEMSLLISPCEVSLVQGFPDH